MIIPRDAIETREVLSWKGLHLLHFHGSTCSQKVRLMLGELGLAWKSHPVNLMKGRNSTPWFLGINPRGVVPVLVHDGVVHVESNDMIAYLDSTFRQPDRSYFFTASDPLAAEARALLDLEDSMHLDLRLLTIQFGPLTLKNEKQIDAQENNGATDKQRDHEVLWWRQKLAKGISDEETRDACGRFSAVFDQLDARLETRRWLMGEELSIVDISWFTNIQRLLNLGYPLERHPRLQVYYRHLVTRPAFKAELGRPTARIGKLVFALVAKFKGRRGRALARLL